LYFGIYDAGIEALACARHFTTSTSATVHKAVEDQE